MNSILKSKWLLIGIVIFSISSLAVFLYSSKFIQTSESISFGILLDLLITIPLIYLFVIWKKQIPKFTVAYVFVAGIFIAKFLLPNSQQDLIKQVQYLVIPLIEIGILGIVLYKMRAISLQFKSSDELDFFNRLIIACQEVFPKRVAKILATEISMFYYLFDFSKNQKIKPNQFTYFKRSGIKMVLSVFLFLILIETIVVHILISNWNESIAWLLTFISAYTLIQILAIMRSMSKRLISVDLDSKTLHLKYGIGCQTDIPFNQLSSIEKFRNSHTKDDNHIFLSLFDLLDSNNITIKLKSQNTLYKLYGIEKRYQSISMFIDDKDHFEKLIKSAIDSEQS